MNFAEFPLASVSRGRNRRATSDTELVFEDTIRDRKTGRTIERRLTIRAHPKYGIPTAYDEDVLIALIHHTKQVNNFRDRLVSLNRKSLLNVLGWPDSGHSYHRLDESLARWVNTHLHYTNWWDKSRSAWVEEHFHVLDNFSLIRKRPARNELNEPAHALSFFQWNTVVFNSFQAGNLKQLDLDTYFRLSLAPARRAYRYLDKYFYRTGRLELDLQTFACEHVGLSRSHTPSKLKSKLQPSIMELEREQVIAPLEVNERYIKRQDQTWRIVFTKPSTEISNPEATRSEVLRQNEIASLPERTTNPSEAELLKRGVSAKKAKTLAASFSVELIANKCRIYDELMKHKSSGINRNPPGWLVRSIEENYAPLLPAPPVPQLPRPTTSGSPVRPKMVQAVSMPNRPSLLETHYRHLPEREQDLIRHRACQSANPVLRDSFQRAIQAGKKQRAQSLLDVIIENYLRSQSEIPKE